MKKLFLLGLFIYSGSVCMAKTRLPNNVDKNSHYTLTSTYYNPTKAQCNNNPCITASGDKIDLKKLKSGKIKWVALSRDLFQLGFKMNEVIFIEELNDYYIIKDTMNARFSRRIDILQHQTHKPLQFTKLTIRKVIKK